MACYIASTVSNTVMPIVHNSDFPCHSSRTPPSVRMEWPQYYSMSVDIVNLQRPSHCVYS